MRTIATLVGTLWLLSIATPVLAANSVRVESISVPIGADSIELGIFVSNDDSVAALIVPLEIRSLTTGAYISDTFAFGLQGRLSSSLSGQTAKRYFPRKNAAFSWRCNASGYDTSGTIDFVSPDAFYFGALRTFGSCLAPGSDDSTDSPSIVVHFGVTSNYGLFEIDTTCVAPANHLMFVGGDTMSTVVTPTFQKGTIQIGGPLWIPDTIAGAVSSSVSIFKNTRLTGDMIVDSGVSVKVVPGVTLTAASRQDVTHSGADSTLSEIIVYGELIIDTTAAQSPRFVCEADSAGTWYGIRVMAGGRVKAGSGAVIENAVIGISVDSGAVAETLRGLRISDCSVAGIQTASSDVTLESDTVIGIESGYGIYIDHADPSVKRCVIDSCEYGIYAFLSSSRLTENRVDGPGVYGIYVASGAIYEDVDSVYLLRDTVTGYFSGAHLSVNTIDWCFVDSCGFISNPSGQRSPYGIKAGFGSSVRMRRSTVKDFTTRGFDSYQSGANLGKLKSENNNSGDNGENDIISDSTTCSPCNPKRVVQMGAMLHAHGNWWGADPPLSSWFTGNVHYTEPLDGPSTAKVVAPVASTDDVLPKEYALAQNYPNPFNPSTTIEFSIPTAQDVRIDIYNILGQRVRTLLSDYVEPGRHQVTWDGTDGDGTTLASGLYLYRLTAGSFTETRKMQLLK